MKAKLLSLLLGAAFSATFIPANEPAVPTPETAPAAAAPAPAAARPVAAKPDAPAPQADEVVPLIVIDEVPLSDAIRNLARQAGLNFQFDPRVTSSNQPNVSIRFENVTAQEALGAVLENYNLTLAKDSKSKIARITVKDPKADEPLKLQVIQLKYSDPTNLVEVVKPTLSSRSRILADTRTRQLIVSATEKELEALTVLISTLDTATRQVLIEAHIFETAKNPQTVKGINWAGTFEGQNVAFGNGKFDTSKTANGGIYPGLDTPTTFQYGGKDEVAPIFVGDGGLIASTARGLFPRTAFLTADGVRAVISFFNTDSDTEVVATPRAVTLDNQPARLSITRAYPIFQITPGSANSPAGATVNYTNLGTILTVLPRIAADKQISMKVEPEVSNIDGKDTQTLDGRLNIANIYAIRKIETHVMIPSGNTLVMGGLMNDSSTKAYSKVPLLGDAPVIGAAFRHSKKARQKQNLVIFVTPTIVETEDFQPTASGSDYMKTPIQQLPEAKVTAWDSAKPHDWTKPVE